MHFEPKMARSGSFGESSGRAPVTIFWRLSTKNIKENYHGLLGGFLYSKPNTGKGGLGYLLRVRSRWLRAQVSECPSPAQRILTPTSLCVCVLCVWGSVCPSVCPCARVFAHSNEHQSSMYDICIYNCLFPLPTPTSQIDSDGFRWIQMDSDGFRWLYIYI
jgi:hypothetical protein